MKMTHYRRMTLLDTAVQFWPNRPGLLTKLFPI
jgi:hypothetical protein